jgi:glycosyltransferase involved in cell wall biosynthesis
MNPSLSVVVPAHNPRKDYLLRVLDALRRQTLPMERWELVVVDNQSAPPLKGRLDLQWHPGSEVLLEERLGLTHARVAGFRRARGDIVVLVDDDNVLAPDYLEQVSRIAADFPFVAVWGGAMRPEYEDRAFSPPAHLWSLLTLREVDRDRWSNDPDHHASTPWGAGLCVRREVFERHCAELQDNPGRYNLDLQGTRLLYGGDTDIAYTACRMGRAKGVFRALALTHLISRSRCTPEYLCRVAYGRGYSEVLHFQSLHGQPAEPEGGLGHWARMRYRQLRMSALERSVDRAHFRGRTDALNELGKQSGCSEG